MSDKIDSQYSMVQLDASELYDAVIAIADYVLGNAPGGHQVHRQLLNVMAGLRKAGAMLHDEPVGAKSTDIDEAVASTPEPVVAPVKSEPLVPVVPTTPSVPVLAAVPPITFDSGKSAPAEDKVTAKVTGPVKSDIKP